MFEEEKSDQTDGRGLAGKQEGGTHHAWVSHGDEEGRDRAAFFTDETAEKGLSLLPGALVSTQEHKNPLKQISSVVFGIMTQRYFFPPPS